MNTWFHKSLAHAAEITDANGLVRKGKLINTVLQIKAFSGCNGDVKPDTLLLHDPKTFDEHRSTEHKTIEHREG